MFKVTKVSVAHRLTERFGLEDLTPRGLTLSKRIFMTTDVGQLLTKTETFTETGDISGAGGYVVFMEVPRGKRRKLRWLLIPATTGSTGVYINVNKTSTRAKYTPYGTTETLLNNIDIEMDELGTVELRGTSNGADNARQLFGGYTEQDMF